MINYVEIIKRLKEIHDDGYGPQFTQEEIDASFAAGMHNPCGCAICLLINDVTFAELEMMQAKRKEAQNE